MAFAFINGDSIKINYYSPGVRKRVTWGGLVPDDEMWVTGANDATTIEFGKQLNVNGEEILACKYAYTFGHLSKNTVSVVSELGTVQKLGNKWSIFDFLWMMHNMEYESRDHIGNWLLRAFSIFGLITVLSGFALHLSA
ncbi:MAG: DUF2911 domain-containing protein [Sphingobacteriales bacterium]|nr:DUF2911 domain-containing protein [Sphingobacteriales bacterium]MBI3717554.1 DUF2911 domain-containing protein [Sphingobacteriales bacterium]